MREVRDLEDLIDRLEVNICLLDVWKVRPVYRRVVAPDFFIYKDGFLFYSNSLIILIDFLMGATGLGGYTLGGY